jgi:PIN domain nuclease of toxin-antitoxin system
VTRLLLDTHILLWATARSERLSAAARAVLEDPDHVLLWSAVGTAELAVKASIGKLQLPSPVAPFVDRHVRKLGLERLPLDDRHAAMIETLPLHHRDPFDRLLIAQALVEEVPIVTADQAFRLYEVEVIW